MIFYCFGDGTGPLPSVDWDARFDAARDRRLSALSAADRADAAAVISALDAAQDEVSAEIRGDRSHIRRNGNAPWAALDGDRIPSADVASGLASGALGVLATGDADAHGGKLAHVTRANRPDGLAGYLFCPECSAPIWVKV